MTRFTRQKVQEVVALVEGESGPAQGDRLRLPHTIHAATRSDTNTSPSNIIAYSAALPPEGLANLRQLLLTSTHTPNGVALIQGLSREIELIDESARAMQSAYQRGNRAGTQQNAEAILNILAGEQSADHKDWNGDGQVTVPGDGFGLLPDDMQPGYIQAVLIEVDSAINSLNATQHMVNHGDEVNICGENLTVWTLELWDLAPTIVTAPSGTDLSQPILDAVKSADQLLYGVDVDNDRSIDAISGECGMSSLYGYAYCMADMTLLPFDPSTVIFTDTPTPTNTVTPALNNNGGGGSSGGNTPAPSNPTSKPPNTRKPPTNTPKPKK